MQQALCPVLIGRADELRLLDAGLLGATRRQGSAYVIVGEAGVGKTRLAAEVRDRATKASMVTLWGACSEAELALPYLAIVQAIGGYLATADLAEVVKKLGPLSTDLSRLFPRLPGASTQNADLDTTERKLRLFESVVALISAAFSPRGGLLVIEDLHWSDSATRELVTYIVRRLTGIPAMVLVTIRRDELHRRHPLQPLLEEWRRGADANVIDVSPLDEREVTAMVRAIFQMSIVKDEFRDLLVIRSSGNPFVIEEMLKDAIDRGDIFRTTSGWDRKPISELRLPARLRDAIMSRVERLTPFHLEVLRAVAVLGRPATVEMLAKVVERDERDVQRALTDCVEYQLLGSREGRYVFRHALTREAVYDDLIPPEKRRLHSRVADVLASDTETDQVEICHHLFAAGEWDSAVPLALQVAEQATAASALVNAASLYERVLPHVGDPAHRARIVWLLCQTLGDLGEWARAAQYGATEIPRLEIGGETAGAARLRIGLAKAYERVGRRSEALRELDIARRFLETRTSSADLADAYRLQANFYLLDFQHRAGVEAARRAVSVATEVRDWPRLIDSYHYLGGNLYMAGQSEEGLAYFDRAIEEGLARRQFASALDAIGNELECFLWEFRFAEATARLELWRSLIPDSHMGGFLWHQGMIRWRRGDLVGAVASYRESSHLYRKRGSLRIATEVEIWLAVALAEAGELGACAAVLASGSSMTTQQRVPEAWARMRMSLDRGDLERALTETVIVAEAARWPARDRRWLAEISVEVLLAAGKLADARQIASRIGAVPVDPYQIRMEGHLALAAGDFQLATERFRACADFWQEVGGHLEEARSRRLLGVALLQGGDGGAAAKELRRAYGGAVRCSAATEIRLAKEKLLRVGEPPEPTSAQVRRALEVLHQTSVLGESDLLSSMTLLMDIDVAGLRNLLENEVRELSKSPSDEDREAGNVLLDCYLNRVGSHEVVAERLHLSRRTFYRRLDRGIALVTERLGRLKAPVTI